MRKKHLTKRERSRLAEEEALAASMEAAFAIRPIHLDIETGQIISGRISSSQPNLQWRQRLTGIKFEIAEDLKMKFRLEHPNIAEYFWASPEFTIRASTNPGMLAAIDILHKADYASIEKHVLGYIQDNSDSRARYESLLLSIFGDDPLVKVVELGEQAQEEALC